jgi:hypothetical protein
MSTLSNTPKVLRGAIVGINPLDPIASVVIFQYNPDSLQRTLQPQMAGGGGETSDRGEALRLKGPPVETIKVDVEIDATDQLETGDSNAQSMGIYPQLSALEMLVYPPSSLVIANTVLMAAGTLEIIPPMAALTIFVWGPKRAIPVRLTEFTITEEAHDASLNPIRAKVSLGLRVLTYDDLDLTNPGYALFLAYQVAKEAMAVIGSAGGLGSVLGGNAQIL